MIQYKVVQQLTYLFTTLSTI